MESFALLFAVTHEKVLKCNDTWPSHYFIFVENSKLCLQCIDPENNAAGKPYLLCAPGAAGVNQETFLTGCSAATHTNVET